MPPVVLVPHYENDLLVICLCGLTLIILNDSSTIMVKNLTARYNANVRADPETQSFRDRSGTVRWARRELPAWDRIIDDTRAERISITAPMHLTHEQIRRYYGNRLESREDKRLTFQRHVAYEPMIIAADRNAAARRAARKTIRSARIGKITPATRPRHFK